MTQSYRYSPSRGNRIAAVALSLALCALIVFALIRMGWLEPGGGGAPERLTAVTFRGDSEEKAQQRQRAEKRATRAATERRVQPTVTPQPTPEIVSPVPWLQMSRADFAASDISKLPRQAAQSAGDEGSQGGKAAGPGEGPGGARLYNAQWYREPTDAELITYMPRRDVAGGWAMIACRTQERFRVEDCRELGESPPGSGLARALRQAAWQFLVRPPRIDGKPQIGVWVRIRFDFTKAKGSAGGGEPPPD